MKVAAEDGAQPQGRPLRVTVLTMAFPPFGGGGTMRMAKLTKYLDQQGWQVTVIRSVEDDAPVLDLDLAAELPRSVVVKSVSGPFRFLGRRAKNVSNAAESSRPRFVRAAIEGAKAAVRSVLIPDRYLGWAWRVSRLTREELGHPEVLLSSGPPHSVHLAAAAISRRLSVPLVIDLRDDWASSSLGRNPAPWRRPIEERLEKKAFLRAARIVHVSEASARLLARRYPTLPGRFFGIPNGFDPDDLVGLPPRVARIDRPVMFLYAGSLRGTQHVGAFPEVFGGRARRQPGTMRLRLVGPFEDRFARAFSEGIDPLDLAIEPPVPHRAALEAMASADVLVAFTGGGGAGSNTITGKIFEYLALKRPVLVIGPRGPATELVETSQVGASADPDDPAGLGEAIRRVISMASNPHFDGAPAGVLVDFDRGELARRYTVVLESAIAGVDRDSYLHDAPLLDDPP